MLKAKIGNKPCHKTLWSLPDARTENQTDDLAVIDDGSRSSLQDVSVKRSADVGPSHHRMVLQLTMKLAASKKGKNLRRRYGVRMKTNRRIEGGNPVKAVELL